MNSLTTKQKIIIGIVIGVMILIIGIYGYSMIEQENIWKEGESEVEENLQNEEMNQANEDVGNSKSTKNQENTNQMDNFKKQENTISQLEENSMNGYENLEGKIVVHIIGAVQKTGILVLPEGARIADAIDASRRDNRKCKFG